MFPLGKGDEAEAAEGEQAEGSRPAACLATPAGARRGFGQARGVREAVFFVHGEGVLDWLGWSWRARELRLEEVSLGGWGWRMSRR